MTLITLHESILMLFLVDNLMQCARDFQHINKLSSLSSLESALNFYDSWRANRVGPQSSKVGQ